MTALDQTRPFGVAPSRTPVEFDPAGLTMRIGEHERRIADPSVPAQVYSAYLSLLHAVRGTRPGSRLPLRSADLEALLLIVGDDPETIEQRLVGLMGISAQEASVLGGLLLRHRRSMAALGAVAALAGGVATTALGPDASTSRGAGVESGVSPSTLAAPAPAPAPVAAAGPVTAVTVQAAAPVVAPVRGPVTGVPRTARATAVTSDSSVTSLSLTRTSGATSTSTPPVVAEDVPAAPAAAAAAPAAPPVVAESDGVVWDAPPPEPEAPSSAVGEAVSLFLDVAPAGATPIQGTSSPSETGPAAPAEDASVPVALPEGYTAISGTTMSDGHDSPPEPSEGLTVGADPSEVPAGDSAGPAGATAESDGSTSFGASAEAAPVVGDV